ncbi:transposase [Gammaproteobacteria bacterium LSUCC0112]|nr:transposase [Gammaproteobacteria bacterium LSUCC0112]
MARRPRYYIPGMPYHIVQRGNNRSLCFNDSADRRRYLEIWAKISERYGVRVHAYCLMSNHAHILGTCGHVDSISRTMRDIGSSYVWYFNKKYQRTGTLWEGRHHASVIQSSRHLLNCYRYIESNPVRANMVIHPADYEWSSYGCNANGQPSWLTEHDEYTALGTSKPERLAAYRQLFDSPLDELEIELFRTCLRSCAPVGDKRFIDDLVARHGVRIGYGAGSEELGSERSFFDLSDPSPSDPN